MMSCRTLDHTAIDQCSKRLQACVHANGGHSNTFCEQTVANNLHFNVFWFKWLLAVHRVKIFTVLMLDVDKPTLLNCKDLIKLVKNSERTKSKMLLFCIVLVNRCTYFHDI